MEKENNLDTLTKCIHDKLKRESDMRGLIKRKNILIILGKVYHIPKQERNNVIKDLESNGVLEIINQIEIRIN